MWHIDPVCVNLAQLLRWVLVNKRESGLQLAFCTSYMAGLSVRCMGPWVTLRIPSSNGQPPRDWHATSTARSGRVVPMRAFSLQSAGELLTFIVFRNIAALQMITA